MVIAHISHYMYVVWFIFVVIIILKSKAVFCRWCSYMCMYVYMYVYACRRELVQTYVLATVHAIIEHNDNLQVWYYCNSSVPGKRPLLGKHPCTALPRNQCTNMWKFFSFWVSPHVGQSCDLCLSAHEQLPWTLRYMLGVAACSLMTRSDYCLNFTYII